MCVCVWYSATHKIQTVLPKIPLEEELYLVPGAQFENLERESLIHRPEDIPLLDSLVRLVIAEGGGKPISKDNIKEMYKS